MKLSTLPISPKLLCNPIHFISLGFGAGLSPLAPGTIGTLVGVILYLLSAPLSNETYVTFVVIGAILGVFFCGHTARKVGNHDPSSIVWDEIIGMMIAMIAIPFKWQWILFAFFLFRLLDIFKPWPIRIIDRNVKGGFGIMLDDIVAGFATFIIVQIAVFILSS